MGEFNKIEYQNQYNRDHYIRYHFRVKKSEQEVIDWIKSQPNTSAYLLELIKEDMKKKGN